MTTIQQRSPLFSNFRPDPNVINSIVLKEWGLSLGPLIKASQNHTFSAYNPNTKVKYVVRVTHALEGEISKYSTEQRVADELFFVLFVSEKRLEGVCAPVAKKSNECKVFQPSDLYIYIENLIICVFQWAVGNPIDFMALEWLTNEKIVYAQGRWLAELHKITMDFSIEHYAIALRMRRWNQLHSGVLKGVKISNEDKLALNNIYPHTNNVGIIHGDLNVSNFFLRSSEELSTNEQTVEYIKLSVFDWDQVQWAWFEYDIAQCMVACVMLAEAGLPPSHDPVPCANLARFEELIVAGYESVRGDGTVNRDRLARMLRLRKIFYCRFCRRAAVEGDLPEDMAWFIHYVNRWMTNFPISEEELGTDFDEDDGREDDEYRGIFEVSCDQQPDNRLSFGSHADQVCDIYRARVGPPLGPLLLIHGGYWRPEYDRGHLRPLAVYLASLGWEVALTEYRRIPGQPDLMVEDIRESSAAFHKYYAQEVLGGSGTDFGITAVGHSAGGHLALLCVGGNAVKSTSTDCPSSSSPRTGSSNVSATCYLRGVVALAPVADLQAAEDLQLDDQAVAAFLGPSVTASLRQDLDPSLLDYGRNTPIFFIHGNKDIRVPVEMSRYVTAKLKNAGERIAYLEMDNVGHFELIDPSFAVVREALSAGLQFTFP